MINLTKITDKLISSKWMLTKSNLYSLQSTVQNLKNLRSGGLYSKIFGEPITTKAIDIPNNTNDNKESDGDIAVINVSGILSKGASEIEELLFGMTDTDVISYELDKAASDPSIKSIVLAFSSPGGETVGIEELGRKIKTIDETVKPVYAWTETMMASAALWLGSQARYIGMTPSSTVGSCGVYCLVLDATKQMEKEGISVEPIFSGKFKMMGHEFISLSDEERKILQNDVDKQHNKFKEVIKAKRSGVPDEALEGLTYEGEDALKLNLVDEVTDSFDRFLQTIANQ